jgi:hypothetical protein
MSYSSSITEDPTSDYVYYNATIINNRTNAPFDRNSDPYVRFQETRDVPIIQDASKYNFSIVRFTMNGPNKDLPLFIPPIRTGPVDNPTQNIDLTIYSVSIQIAMNSTSGANPVNVTLTSTQPIIYVSETADDILAPTPPPETTVTGQDVSTRYYWVYSYSSWLNCVNTAFQNCITALQTQFQTAWAAAGNAGTAPALKTSAPYITYDGPTNLFSLYADAQSFGPSSIRMSAGTTQNETATVYFNSNMNGLFDNFRNTYVNTPNTELTNLIYTGPVGYGAVTAGVPYGENIVAIGSGASLKYFWKMTQDYESTSTLWSPIESIVFNSTMLPLVFEATGDPIIFGDSNTNTSSGGSRPAFQPIITDVALPLESAQSYRELIYYSPSAEYRMASFQRSKQPINQIDIQVYYKNRLDGQIYPIQMYNCSSVSVKIMFRKRGVQS